MQFTFFDPDNLAQRYGQLRHPYFWISVICFMFVVPAIVLRGSHFEEGTVISLARGAFEDGHWLAPFRYGERFVERPVLFSWLLATLGLATGILTDWMARIPVALSLLGGASLVFYLIRQYASVTAGLFGVLCFIASPVVLTKVVTAETDLFVSVIVFSAFVVLWNAERQGGAGVGRWLVVGLILSVAALVKGPPPLGFFFIGLGAFFLLRRRWLDFIKLGFVGLMPAALLVAWYASVYQPGDEATWASYNRLNPIPFGRWIYDAFEFIARAAFDFLPGWPLLIPLAAVALRRPPSREDDVILALVCYAALCTVLLALWPGSRGRYAMPATLAIGAAAGIAFDRLRGEYPRLIKATSIFIAALVFYRVALNWLVMPLAPELFQRSRHHGHLIAAAVMTRPGPIYVAREAMNKDFFVYVPYRAHRVSFDAIAALDAPAWAMVTPEQERRLRAQKSDAAVILHVLGAWPFAWRLVDIRKN